MPKLALMETAGDCVARRVLVCDDEPEVRELYRFALEQAGAEVAEAVDGLASIAMTESFHPDLVVLDLAMPRCDGLKALPEILRKAPGVNVVIVTAYSSTEAFAAGRRLGARACYQKERFVPAIPDVLRRWGC